MSSGAAVKPETLPRTNAFFGLFRLIYIILVFLPLFRDIWVDRILATDAPLTLWRRILRAYAQSVVDARDFHPDMHLRERAVRLREALTRLGPAFIKIGQALSTRPDVLPVYYIHELQRLQDQVPAFPHRKALRIIQKDLGRSIAEMFSELPDQPISAGSLGQVYRARLKDGTVVAVKVQRPRLHAIVEKDFAALYLVARIMRRYQGADSGVDWSSSVCDLFGMLRQEADFQVEMHNADAFRANFAKWDEIHVPVIYPEFSSRRVITMEFIEGVRVDDDRALAAQRKDPMEILELAVRSYLKQLIEDGFFHADPHPGNLRLMPDGRLAFLDFGMVGRLEEKDRSRFLDLLIHVAERDTNGIVEDLYALRFLRPGTTGQDFIPVVQQTFRKYLGHVKASSIRFHELVNAMSEVVYKYPFTIPPQFAFILRAILTIEGLGLHFNPRFSVFLAIKPHALDFLFFREIKGFFRNLFSLDKEAGIQWERARKAAGIFWRQYRQRFFPDTKPTPPTPEKS